MEFAIKSVESLDTKGQTFREFSIACDFGRWVNRYRVSPVPGPGSVVVDQFRLADGRYEHMGRRSFSTVRAAYEAMNDAGTLAGIALSSIYRGAVDLDAARARGADGAPLPLPEVP